MPLQVTDLTTDEKMVVAEFAHSGAFAAMVKAMTTTFCNDWMAAPTVEMREQARHRLDALHEVETAIKIISKKMRAV